MYKFKIDKLELNSMGELQCIEPKQINVIIGPNNSGKSRFLKELRDWLSGDKNNIKIINSMKFTYPKSFDHLEKSYNIKNKIIKDRFGNLVLRTYLNKPTQPWDPNTTYENYYMNNLNCIETSWKENFQDIIQGKNEISFFHYFGPLFFKYIGTEERLTICKIQTNYGMDSNNMNYLTSFKFEDKVLCELSCKVREIFNKDIILDTQTLGDRLVFRVGNDLGYARKSEKTNDTVAKLFGEEMLDNQGDGLKSYVSIFLSLRAKENDVLIIDEPEAFLHPSLARQVGELIGELDSEKQIFVSTHSVEILKGLLSQNKNINVIRITQPRPLQNKIDLVSQKMLLEIIKTPLLRVSRVLEGLFCKKVIITEAEADEIVYQELIEKVFPQSGLYFAHGQNKQTLLDIAKMYRHIGVNYEIIVDFDILIIRNEFNKFLNEMSIDDREKQVYRQYIDKFNSKIKEKKSTEDKKDNQKVTNSNVYHREGINFLEDGELKNNIADFIEKMAINHLHILKTGELETILVPFGIEYTTNKRNWFVKAMEKITSLSKENIKDNKDIYEFLKKIVEN